MTNKSDEKTAFEPAAVYMPHGFWKIEAYTNGYQIVVEGNPPDSEDLGVDEWHPVLHDCDAMGCGQAHVLFRINVPQPAMPLMWTNPDWKPVKQETLAMDRNDALWTLKQLANAARPFPTDGSEDYEQGRAAANSLFFRLAHAVLPGLIELVELGYTLSGYAASINWGSKGANTPEWLKGLREFIEAYQQMYQGFTVPPAEEKIE